MKYQKQQKMSGQWVDKKTLESGTKCKIVSETTNIPSQFKDKDGNPQTQDVCKIIFGDSKESVNVGLNRATIDALIDAHGEDSIDWQNKPLTVEIEKMRVANVARLGLYLIPEGYEKTDDDNGYAVIRKSSSKNLQKDIPVINEDEIDVAEMPF